MKKIQKYLPAIGIIIGCIGVILFSFYEYLFGMISAMYCTIGFAYWELCNRLDRLEDKDARIKTIYVDTACFKCVYWDSENYSCKNQDREARQSERRSTPELRRQKEE